MKSRKFIITYFPFLLMLLIILAVFAEFSDKIFSETANQSSNYIEDFNAMISWIKSNTEQNDVILSEWELGTLITGYTGRKAIATSKVYPSEALLVSERYKDLSRFFFSLDEKTALQILQKYNVSYILISNTMDFGACKYINSCSRDNFLYRKAFSGNPKITEKTMVAKLLHNQKSDYFKLMINNRNFKIYKVMKQNLALPSSQKYFLDSGFYKFNDTIKNDLEKFARHASFGSLRASQDELASHLTRNSLTNSQRIFQAPQYFNVQGAIVPHGIPYSLSQIADLFNSLGDEYTNIILIGPDHEDVSSDFAVTSAKNWTTPFGELHSDSINKLGIQENDYAMINDWSLRVLLPFVKFKYPEAKIMPVLVKSEHGKERYIELGKKIAHISNSSTLILLSLDFSHIDNITNTDLNFEEDLKALEIIKSLELNRVDEMEVESKNPVYVFLSAMKAKQATSFILLNLSNSIYIENGRGVGFITAIYK